MNEGVKRSRTRPVNKKKHSGENDVLSTPKNLIFSHKGEKTKSREIPSILNTILGPKRFLELPLLPKIPSVPVDYYKFPFQLRKEHLIGKEIWRGTDVEGNCFISFCVKNNLGEIKAYSIAEVDGMFCIHGSITYTSVKLDTIARLKKLFEGEVVEDFENPFRLTPEQSYIRLTNQLEPEDKNRTTRRL